MTEPFIVIFVPGGNTKKPEPKLELFKVALSAGPVNVIDSPGGVCKLFQTEPRISPLTVPFTNALSNCAFFQEPGISSEEDRPFI